MMAQRNGEAQCTYLGRGDPSSAEELDSETVSSLAKFDQVPEALGLFGGYDSRL